MLLGAVNMSAWLSVSSLIMLTSGGSSMAVQTKPFCSQTDQILDQ